LSWFLDYIIRAKNDAKPAVTEAAKDLEKLEKQTEETQKATQKWTAQQQRAAMAMSAMHEQAAKLDAEMSKSGLSKLGDSVKQSWAQVGPAALSAAAGFLAFEGVKALVVGTAQAVADLAGKAEAIQQKSALTGWSVEAVQSMERVSAGAGVSSDGVYAAMTKLQRGAVEGSKGFQTLGMSTQQFLALSGEEQFQAVAEHVMSMATPAERSAAAMELLGKSGATLMPVLERVAAGAMDVSVALSEDQVSSLAELDDALDDATGAWEDLQNQVLASIASNPDAVQGIKDLASSLAGMAGSAKGASSNISATLQLLGQFSGMSGPNSPLGLLRALSVGIGEKAPGGKGKTAWDQWAGGPGQMDTSAIDKAAMDAVKVFEKADKARIASGKKVEAEHARAQKQMAREEEARINASLVAISKTQGLTGELNAWFIAEDEKTEARRTKVHSKAVRDQWEVDEWLAAQREEAAAREAEELEERYQDVMGLLDAVREFGDAVGGTFGSIVSSGAGAMQTFMGISKAIEEGATGLEKMAMGLQALTSAYKSGSVGGGAATGAAAGLALSGGNPLGAAIGGIVGGIAGLFGKGKKEKQERAEVEEARRALIETAGGIEQLRAKADMAGISLSKMLNAKKARDYEAAVKDVKRALDLQDEAQEKINAAVQKYGLTIEDLGPAWARQELDTRAAGILESYKLLEAKGADMHAVLAKMGPDVNDYVQQSIRAGTAIPEAMRPIIEQLIQSGQLLDENGEAYGSLEDAGVTFADSMTDTFKSMNEAMWELVRVMGGEVPAAIRRAGEAAGAAARQAGGITGEASNDNYTEEPIYAAAGYSGWVSRPTRFVAGEGGQPEHVQVTPRSAMAGGGGGGMAGDSGPRQIVLPVQAGGMDFGQILLNKTSTGHWRADSSGFRVRG
jgi:uncharacterized protein YoxC/gas vesicle protein